MNTYYLLTSEHKSLNSLRLFYEGSWAGLIVHCKKDKVVRTRTIIKTEKMFVEMICLFSTAFLGHKLFFRSRTKLASFCAQKLTKEGGGVTLIYVQWMKIFCMIFRKIYCFLALAWHIFWNLPNPLDGWTFSNLD